jgi:hypothetical protein
VRWKKQYLTFLLILAGLAIQGQELNVGGFAGTGPWTWGVSGGVLGGAVEFRPGHAIFSLNAEPHIIFNSGDLFFTAPLYMKFILGNRFRFCPTMGGFWRSNGNFGWSAGLNLEFGLKEGLFLFFRGDLNKDYYKTKYPDHLGGSYPITESGYTVWTNLGLKISILKSEE